MTDLLRPDNHELFVHVRLMAVARNPVLSWEEIAGRVGLEDGDVPALLGWFISYRLPPPLTRRTVPDEFIAPRDPNLRAEYYRLRGRERSLVTVATEAPAQLAKVQLRLASLERTR